MQNLLLVLTYLSVLLSTAFAGTYSGGNGTQATPYLISNEADLLELKNTLTDWGSNIYFQQTADITITNTWTTIGNGANAFSGNYDGNNKSITGINFSSPTTSHVGLFGYISNANVSNVKVVNCNFTGNYYVGGVIGYAYQSTVSNCSFSGAINGTQYVGGLIGFTNSSTIVSECSSSGSVTGNQDVGGLIGYFSASTINKSFTASDASVTGGIIVGGFVGQNINSTISNCYSLNNVVRTSAGQYSSSTGSFVGKNYSATGSTISYCYATGSVTYIGYSAPTDKGFVGSYESYSGGQFTYTANYFNTQTTGQTTGTGATGKTTTEMTTEAQTYPNFYSASGWSFKTNDNPSGIWNINSSKNNGYPFLVWQYPDESPLPVELTMFEAKILGNKIILQWQTATEINNYGFEIEKAEIKEQKELEFNKIGFVKGQGNSNKISDYTYTDDKNINGKIAYRLKQIDNDGNYKYSKVIEVENKSIISYYLGQNYPNPFNPSTTIEYYIPKDEHVTLKVYDMLGKEVETLINKNERAGLHKVQFETKNYIGGIYIYVLKAGAFKEAKKMLLLK